MQELKILNVCFIFHLLLFISSCNGQNQLKQNNPPTEKNKLEASSKTTSYEKHDKVTCSILDKAGNLWFGTSNEGVYRYDGKSFVNFTEHDGLSSNYINCIVEDTEGMLWFGSNDGLSKYDGKSFTEVPVPWDDEKNIGTDWWNSNIVQCMLQDRNGDLWLGTGGHGVYRYDGKNFTNFSFTNDMPQSDGLHHNYIQSMIEDNAGNIWFTSMTHGGISRYDGEKFTHFSSKDGLLDDMVHSSFQDKSGKLWFGSIQTKHKGLYYLEGDSFSGYGKEDGLCDNFVTGFFEDKHGKFWIRTGSTLCIFDGKNFSPFLTEEGKELKGISFIIEDKKQNIWLGGQYGHIWKYDGKTLSDFTNKSH